MNKKDTTTATKAAYTGDIPNTPIRFLGMVSRPHLKWGIPAMFVVVVASSFDTLLSAVFIQQLIESAQAGDVTRTLIIATLYPVAVFLADILWRSSGLLGRLWAVGVRKDSTDVLFKYILNHSHGYFADRFAGSLLNKITNVRNSLERIIIDTLWKHLDGIVSAVAATTFIYLIDPRTSFIFIGLVVFIVGLNAVLVPRKRVFSRESADSNTQLGGRIVDTITNVAAVRQFSRKKDEYLSLQEYSQDSRDKHSLSWLYSEYMMHVNGVVLFVFSTGMFISLSNRWAEGAVSTAELAAILAMTTNFVGLILFIGRSFNDTANAYGEAEEGLQEILIDHEITDTPHAAKLQVHKAEVQWTNVDYSYGDNKVFDSFDLTIKAGQRVGLVGPSGAGKTTFVSLLLRQHDLDGGSITIDGQNIAEVTQDSLREAIAVVPQEPMLFHRSIYENIAYGNPDATEAMVIEVAQKAQAHEFIAALPEGYDTLVGERGVKLSGGQKQRIAIARAMLKDAPILILDEATSALDSESEVAIQKALHELMEGKTVVAVAHRLSTLREMDRILVLEGGKIVEDGSHQALAEAGGTYQKLWEHQAGGFLQE